jgi:hypothetical protein
VEHLLERVAARVSEVDENDIGIDRRDARQQTRGVANVMDVYRASLT